MPYFTALPLSMPDAKTTTLKHTTTTWLFVCVGCFNSIVYLFMVPLFYFADVITNIKCPFLFKLDRVYLTLSLKNAPPQLVINPVQGSDCFEFLRLP